MWSQRDLETSIRSLVDDISDHIKLVQASSEEPCSELVKLCANARHDLLTLAKKIEVQIEKNR